MLEGLHLAMKMSSLQSANLTYAMNPLEGIHNIFYLKSELFCRLCNCLLRKNINLYIVK